jgi:hypothetical protein
VTVSRERERERESVVGGLAKGEEVVPEIRRVNGIVTDI